MFIDVRPRKKTCPPEVQPAGLAQTNPCRAPSSCLRGERWGSKASPSEYPMGTTPARVGRLAFHSPP